MPAIPWCLGVLWFGSKTEDERKFGGDVWCGFPRESRCIYNLTDKNRYQGKYMCGGVSVFQLARLVADWGSDMNVACFILVDETLVVRPLCPRPSLAPPSPCHTTISIGFFLSLSFPCTNLELSTLLFLCVNLFVIFFFSAQRPRAPCRSSSGAAWWRN